MIWWLFGPYTRWGARRAGRKDGVVSIPHWDDTRQPRYVMQLKQAGDSVVRGLAQKWARRERVLKPKWVNAVRDRNDASQRVDEQSERLKAAEDMYRRTHNDSPPLEGGGTLWYWLVMGLLFVCEFPFNAIVFRLFGESEVLTYLVTGGIATALLGAAHLLGILLREGKWDRTRISFAVMLMAIPILVVSAVAYLRATYLKQVEQQSVDVKMQLGFAVFNFIIFLVAVVASYFAHDPIFLAVHRERKKLARAQGKLLKAQKRCDKALVRGEKTHSYYRNKAHQLKDKIQNLIEVYREENLRIRPDREERFKQGFHQPKSFEEYPEVTIGADIENFDWTEENLA